MGGVTAPKGTTCPQSTGGHFSSTFTHLAMRHRVGSADPSPSTSLSEGTREHVGTNIAIMNEDRKSLFSRRPASASPTCIRVLGTGVASSSVCRICGFPFDYRWLYVCSPKRY